MRYCSLSNLFLLFALCFLAACGTFEVGVEHTAASPQAVAAPTENAQVAQATPARGQPTFTSESPFSTQALSTPAPTAGEGGAASASYQANDHSGSPAISADGRYVAFSSGADNLVPGDTNEVSDIFVRDRQTGATELVSLAEDGSPANGSSDPPGISADGRWIVFASVASNLVAGDENDVSDVFVHDHQTGRTIMVSAAEGGASGNGMSMEPSISADGRWIAFTSYADNLVPEIDEYSGENIADTNEMADVFVYDRFGGGAIRRVSLSSDGEQSNHNSGLPGISGDGRWVVFWSVADNLVPGAGQGIYLYDRSTETIQWIADGFAPSISADGRWIGFLSSSRDLVSEDATCAVLYDQQTSEIAVLGGYAKEIHGWPSSAIHFSMDGEWLAFSSVFESPDSPILGDSKEWGQQVFVFAQKTGVFTLLSATPDGLPGNSYSAWPSLSGDGRWVAFQSLADNLVAGDTNGYVDVFVHDRQAGTTELVSIPVAP
jgi:Tol biopolymer transport system component